MDKKDVRLDEIKFENNDKQSNKLQNDAECCSIEAESENISESMQDETHAHDESDHHTHESAAAWKEFLPAILSFVMLAIGMIMDHYEVNFFADWIRIGWYVIAYLPVGLPVLRHAMIALVSGSIFTEFFLMSIATIGAFAIGEYPEGVAVMLFYTVGELFQGAAVKRAKSNIRALLDVRPKIAHVYRDGGFETIQPAMVEIGERIQVKVGEKIPLDGVLLSETTSLNTAAITGESKPQTIRKGDNALAGSINLESVIEVEVTKKYQDSSVARIIELVQNATSKKAKTELLIRRLAKIYTPIVFYLALAICFLPYFFVDEYIFSTWLYRALIFLVISCPCALVISIPLGYFGGLGAASRNGILFKGATFLDQLKEVNTMVMDKTGTVTKGIFKIKEIEIFNELSEAEFMSLLLAIEAKSTHPIAKAIMEYPLKNDIPEAKDIREIAGKGLQGTVENRTLVVGNQSLMKQFNIDTPEELDDIVETIVLVGVNGQFAGYVTIADEMKEGARETIETFKREGIKEIYMLSGDKDSITQKVAQDIGIDEAKGELLPEEKLQEVERLQKDAGRTIAFMGDGINDAPVLAVSDVGIAMGAMGSDVAIETADVIIQTDQPSKVVTGIHISKATHRIIWQNITMALGVKAIVLILGAVGLASMWGAVFADVGVALLAILNAVRLQRMNWS